MGQAVDSLNFIVELVGELKKFGYCDFSEGSIYGMHFYITEKLLAPNDGKHFHRFIVYDPENSVLFKIRRHGVKGNRTAMELYNAILASDIDVEMKKKVVDNFNLFEDVF